MKGFRLRCGNPYYGGTWPRTKRPLRSPEEAEALRERIEADEQGCPGPHEIIEEDT